MIELKEMEQHKIKYKLLDIKDFIARSATHTANGKYFLQTDGIVRSQEHKYEVSVKILFYTFAYKYKHH